MPETAKKKWKERFQRLRNFQSKDFWAMVFARPLTILFLFPVADLKWVTSNRITIASVLTKLTGIAMLVTIPSYWGGFWAGAVINLGLVLDNMDGTLARYRENSTFIGYYADKMSDIVTLAGIFFAMAWRQYQIGHNLADLVIPMVGFFGVAISAYAKWVANRLLTDIRLHQAMKDNTLDDYARSRLDQNPSTPPPQRNFKDWIHWFYSAVISIREFNEVDINFFVWLSLAINDIRFFTIVVSGIYALGIVAGPIALGLNLGNELKKAGLK